MIPVSIQIFYHSVASPSISLILASAVSVRLNPAVHRAHENDAVRR